MSSTSAVLTKAAGRGDFQKVAALLKQTRRKPLDKDNALLETLSTLTFFKTTVIKGRIVKLRVVPLENVRKTVRLLLDAGANPNAMSRETALTALICAVSDLPSVQMLLDAGADINLQNGDGYSALASAVLSGRTKVVAYLLKNGADPRLRDVDRGSVLDAAKFALQRGPDYRAIYEMVRAAHSKLPRKVAAKPSAAETSTGPGITPFLKFIWNWGHPEWILLAVEAPVERVSKAVASLTSVVQAWPKVPMRASAIKYDQMAVLVAIVQPEDSTWTVIYRAMCYPIGRNGEFESGTKSARELSARLKARALCFAGEDTSMAMGCELFRNGKLADQKVWESQNEPADEFFEKLGVIVPVCYPKRDGKKLWLAVREPWNGRIARADLVELCGQG